MQGMTQHRERYSLSRQLSEEDLAFGARLIRIVKRVQNDPDHVAHNGRRLDVRIFVDDEENVHQIDTRAQYVCAQM